MSDEKYLEMIDKIKKVGQNFNEKQTCTAKELDYFYYTILSLENIPEKYFKSHEKDKMLEKFKKRYSYLFYIKKRGGSFNESN